MASMSTLERLDTPEIDYTLLMELLDESPRVEEEEDVMQDDDRRLGRVIQSLEAEIATFDADADARVHVDRALSDLGGLLGSPCAFDWMEVESSEAAATESSGDAMSGWYLEADDQFMQVLEYYGETTEYNSFCCYNGEQSIEQVEEYGSLWE